YFTSVSRDITETKELEATLEYQAHHDDLTGLPNRKALLDDLESLAVHRDDHPDLVVTALFVDLDHFKVINDSLGHEVGDLLLRECAERIVSVVRPGETVARFGGDEFVVLCEGDDQPGDGDAIAERVESALSEPFDIQGHQVHTTVSIGIATAIAAELDPHELIRDADTAMYHAKSAGRRRWATFDGELRNAAVTRQQIENGLRHALEDNELYLEFQPVAFLENLRPVGAEALLRWNMNGRAVAPVDFIAVAEDTGLIGPIGAWAMNESLRELAQWDQQDLGISVNVSVRQLQAPGFVAQVADLLASSGLDPSRVTLEITETVLLAELTTTSGVLEDLKSLGVSISLDDFGTGYSPLTYLKELPIDEVKLDRSFVAELGTDERARAIASAVISLANAMALKIVAEGIETDLERRVLRDLGCTFGQGTLISAPLAPDDFACTLGSAGSVHES
ncbi:MAG: putative bifunctional diguanylate cyclase/phosphodiesterase, partial [Microthrixaceae bacterium]